MSDTVTAAKPGARIVVVNDHGQVVCSSPAVPTWHYDSASAGLGAVTAALVVALLTRRR